MAYIVLVDDDEDFVDAVKTVMEGAGHEVATVLEAGKAIALMEERKPDLAILDVMFPEDSTAGFDLARLVQRTEKLKGLPVLMLTAVNEKYPFGFSAKDRDDEWFPISDFIEKPVDFDVLTSKVTELLARAQGTA